MTKDEMKNKISMALKDPILQQGFEIICKDILKLEGKISVLLSCKNCPENKGGYICEKEYENKCLTQKIQHIKELQEEIAELKEKNKSYEKIIDNSSTTLMRERLKNYKQLTKAKELIQILIDDLEAIDGEQIRELKDVKEAEQFLTEV